jgi:hypothetical protein
MDTQGAAARVMLTACSLPRTVRNRSPRRKGAKPGGHSPQSSSPRSPVQEEATNSVTGKKAVGPW